MEEMAMAIEDSLTNSGWHLNPKSVLAILSNLSQEPTISSSAFHSLCIAHLLDSDLHEFGSPCLPDSSSLLRIPRLLGPLVLQVVSVRNICESSNKSTISVHQPLGRLLRIGLTDGHTVISVIEYRSMPAFSLNTAPGTKVKLENTISVQNGMLLGDARSLTVLGGHVHSLYEAWEMERKYSTLARPTLKAARIEGDTGPPQFHCLSVGRQVKQGLHAKDSISPGTRAVDTLKATTMSSLAGRGKGILEDNIRTTAEWQNDNGVNKILAPLGKTGKEAHSSTVSKTLLADVSSSKTESDWSSELLPEPLGNSDAVKIADGASTSYYSESKKSLRGSMSSEVLSSGLVASTDLKAQQSEMDIDSRVDAIRAAMALGVETAPLQNRSAAQKLLEKRMDGDIKHMNGRGRGFLARERGRRAGRHEEESTLTLDEWESRKGILNPSKIQATATADDAALAQKLQHQLDLESSTVTTTGLAHDEAEKIRLSMFSFTVDRSADEYNGEKRRGRGRGRGRGRRHGH